MGTVRIKIVPLPPRETSYKVSQYWTQYGQRNTGLTSRYVTYTNGSPGLMLMDDKKNIYAITQKHTHPWSPGSPPD